MGGHGGKRRGAGRPPGKPGALTRAQSSAFVATVAREAHRAYDQAVAKRQAAGLAPPPELDPDDLRAAVAYLTELKMGCIAGAIAAGDFRTAIDGIDRLEDRMIGKVRWGLPGGPDGDGAGTAGPRSLVVVLGANGARVGLDAFGYKPLPRTIPAKAS